jgi:hypothetical protein
LAKYQGFEWVWVDTCCIDKKSSAELSEAINSMYRWYENAAICYAYLSDVQNQGAEGCRVAVGFSQSKWFTRGWTLQELLTPKQVLFLDRRWEVIGSKIPDIEMVKWGDLSQSVSICGEIEEFYLLVCHFYLPKGTSIYVYSAHLAAWGSLIA